MKKATVKKIAKNVSEIKDLKGHYVWWEIKQLDIPKVQLEMHLDKLGYADLVPRNDYKTALRRALRMVLRTDQEKRFYRREEDTKFAQFFVVIPQKIYDDAKRVSDITFKKEMIVKVNKENGRVTFDDDTHPFVETIKEGYREAKKFLDAEQFRALLTRIVKEHCGGCSMKSHGGVYYVPEARIETLEGLRRIFQNFPENICMLFETPVYNDDQTDRAIEHGVSSDILMEMTKVVEEMREKDEEGKVTEKVSINRQNEMKLLMKRIKLHENDLRSQADGIYSKAKKLEEIFGLTVSKVRDGKKFDLTDALNSF